MSRQLEIQREVREDKRQKALVRALEFELPGALETNGIMLLGLAIRYSAFDCLLTLKADIGGKTHVCFVGSDSIINCFLKATRDASNDGLRWREDRFAKRKD